MDVLAVIVMASVLGVGLSCVVAAVRKRRLLLGLAALLLLAVAGAVVGITAMRYAEQQAYMGIDGGITIEASPNIRMYLGESDLGTSLVPIHIRWSDLVESEQGSPTMATLIDPNTETIGPDYVAGQGAEYVSGPPGPGSMLTYGTAAGRIVVRHSDLLLRRADGKMDWVHLIDVTLQNSQGEQRRLLVPLRARFEGDGPAVPLSACQTAMIGRSGAFGAKVSPEVRLKITTGPPPISIPPEAKGKSLWEPGR